MFLEIFPISHMCRSLLYSKRVLHSCFPVNSAKFLRTPFLRTPLNNCFFFLFFRNIVWNTFIAIKLNFYWKALHTTGYNFFLYYHRIILLIEYFLERKNKRFLSKDCLVQLDSSLAVIWLNKINFTLIFSDLTSKYTDVVWQAWERMNPWIGRCCYLKYNTFLKNTRTVTVKNFDGGQKIEGGARPIVKYLCSIC